MPGKSRALPFRRKKGGKEYGPFLVRIGGKDITLRTQDGNAALARAKQAHKGKRDFEPDGGGAAAAVVAAIAGTGGAKTSPVVEPVAPPASGLLSDPPGPTLPPTYTAPPALPPGGAQPQAESAPAGTPAPTVVHPDGYLPPPNGWADQVAAAAGTPGGDGGAGEGGEDFEEIKLTDSELDDILDEAAAYAVELQIGLQAELAARGYLVPKMKVRTVDVPADYKGRAIGKKFWKRCFKKLIAKYFPELDLPDWLVAPVLVFSLTVPVQLGKGATVIKPGAEGATAEGAPRATP